VGKAKKKHHKSDSVPVISAAILLGQALAAWETGGHTAMGALDNFQSFYTGYDYTERAWHLERLAAGYGPWVVKRYASRVAKPGGSISRLVPGISFS
jgi:hypothetical protein